MTTAEFDALSIGESRLLELLEGEVIYRPSPTFEHQNLVSDVTQTLDNHLAKQGALALFDVEFALAASRRDQTR